MWKYPSCNKKIEDLIYIAQTQGWESGTAILTKKYEAEHYDRISDYGYGESETNEVDNYEYECPECNENLSLDDLIWEEEEIIKKTYKHTPCYQCTKENTECHHKIPTCKHCRYNKEPEEEEPEETLHEIISPKNNILSDKTQPNTTKSGIICKNKKCNYLFAYQELDAYDTEKDEFYECPKCGTITSKKDYIKTLKET